jgi:hypothetical protein
VPVTCPLKTLGLLKFEDFVLKIVCSVRLCFLEVLLFFKRCFDVIILTALCLRLIIKICVENKINFERFL